MIGDLPLELDPAASGRPPNFPALPAFDEHSAGSKRERFVAFFLGDQLFGIRAELVVEVMRIVPPTPLPNAPANLAGIAAIRGELAAVVDIKRVFGINSDTDSTRSKLILLAPSDSEIPLAIEVDRMHEVVSLGPEEITDNGYGVGLTGTAALPGGTVKLIDVESIRASIRQ